LIRAWRLLRTGEGEPRFNMALDEALLRGGGPPALRLYGWSPPALSLGHFQPRAAFDEEAVRAAGAVIVRRPTGGGAIHHDRELTFSISAEPGRDGYPAETVEAYRFVHGVLQRALASVGAECTLHGGARLSTRPRDGTLCFLDHTALDLVDAQGRKLAGSAQRRLRTVGREGHAGRVLHHGSLPLQVPRLSPGSGSVALAAGREVSWDELADAVIAAFTEALPAPLLEDRLSGAELEQAARLASIPQLE
jgi:lipoate-protein ligase A